MKNLNAKFVVVFVAWVLFSVFTVFAATITVNTGFSQSAVQYLQNLVLTNSSWTTGIVLDWDGKKIHTDIICNSSGTQCKNIADIFTGIENDPTFNTHSGDYYLKTNQSGYITNLLIWEDLTIGEDKKINIWYNTAVRSNNLWPMAEDAYNTIRIVAKWSVYLAPIDTINICDLANEWMFYFDSTYKQFQFCQADSVWGSNYVRETLP
jgi:hypothetical protein